MYCRIITFFRKGSIFRNKIMLFHLQTKLLLHLEDVQSSDSCSSSVCIGVSC